jgi:V/A-type H+-transporting ATPase subunit K
MLSFSLNFMKGEVRSTPPLDILENIRRNKNMVDPSQMGMVAVGAGLAVGLAGIGAGIGEQAIGAAAVGAMAEDEKFFGKGLLMTVIPESIVIFGLVVSLILLFVY